MKKTCFLFAFTVLCFFAKEKQLTAQVEPQFTSNMFTQQLFNPAIYGEKKMATAFGNLRNQWKNIGPTTYSVYVDAPFTGTKRKHGAGISIIGDEAGLFTVTSVNLAYSHKQKIWDGTLSIGTQLGFVNLIFDGSGVETVSTDYHSNLNEPSLITTETTGLKFDIGLGAHYSNERQYFGLAMTHLAQPELDLSSEDVSTDVYVYYNRTLYLYAGYNMHLRSWPDIELKPNVYFKTDAKTFQIDINCNAWYKDQVFAGMSYRFQDAIALMAGMRLKSGILVGAAYDMTTSRMAYGGFGSTEVFFSYEFSLSLNSKVNKYKSIRIL